MNFLDENVLKKIANSLFYVALLIELVLMIVEKSELYFPYESYVFRVTFVLTFFAVIISRHEKKEWFLIACVWVFTFACYRLTGKNDLLRFATFIMAARNINLGKTMKVSLYVSLAGFATIALLSVLGVLGQVYMVTDYGRDNAQELRYVFGFGHPNTLWGCVYALMLLWLWVYGSKAKWWKYAALLVISLLTGVVTASRTGLLISTFTFVLALIVRFFPMISNKKWFYALTGLLSPVFCVLFSIWGAAVSYVPRYAWEHRHYELITFIDELINNRMQNLYRDNGRHSGALVSWKLFSDHQSVEYFDMGWVRLFYWYGIIPTVLICILLVVFIYICYKRRDAWSMVLFISLSVYTVIEATFVSVYIGRNMLLPVMGVYLGSLFEREKNKCHLKPEK